MNSHILNDRRSRQGFSHNLAHLILASLFMPLSTLAGDYKGGARVLPNSIARLLDVKALTAACLETEKDTVPSLVLAKQQKSCLDSVEELNQNAAKFVDASGPMCQSCSANQGAPIVRWYNIPASSPAAARGRLGSPRFADQLAAFKEASRRSTKREEQSHNLTQINSFADAIQLYFSEHQKRHPNVILADFLTSLSADLQVATNNLRDVLFRRTGAMFSEATLQSEMAVYLVMTTARSAGQRRAILQQVKLPSAARLDILLQIQPHLGTNILGTNGRMDQLASAARDLGFTATFEGATAKKAPLVASDQALGGQGNQIVVQDTSEMTQYLLQIHDQETASTRVSEAHAGIMEASYLSAQDGRRYRIVASAPTAANGSSADAILLGVLDDPYQTASSPASNTGPFGTLTFSGGELSLAVDSESSPGQQDPHQAPQLPPGISKVVASGRLGSSDLIELVAKTEAKGSLPDSGSASVSLKTQYIKGEVQRVVGEDSKTSLKVRTGTDQYNLLLAGEASPGKPVDSNLTLTLAPEIRGQPVKVAAKLDFESEPNKPNRANLNIEAKGERYSAKLSAQRELTTANKEPITYRVELEAKAAELRLGLVADIIRSSTAAESGRSTQAQNVAAQLSTSNRQKTFEQQVGIEASRTKDGAEGTTKLEPTLFYRVKIPF